MVVRVERRVKHPLYGKIIKLSKKYHAHDEGNAFKLGEQIRIEECAPVSKLKSWTVLDRVGEAPAVVDEIKDVDLKPAPDAKPATDEKPAKKAPAKSKAKKAEPEAAEA